MIKTLTTPDLRSALEKLGDLVEREEKNDNVIIFCGDRYTLLAEQTICQRIGGTFSTPVLTFARYLRLHHDKRMLSKQGSVMTVRRLLNEYRGQLNCFTSPHAGEAASGIYDTIIRLSSSKVTPEELANADVGDNGVLKEKIGDLAFLQEKYETFLAKNDFLDESNYFRLLPEVIRTTGEFVGKHIVLFGFPSFAAQMREGIVACLDTAKDVTAFFIDGEEELYRREACPAFLEIAKDHKVVSEVVVGVDESDEAHHLREGLFHPECYVEEGMRTDKVFLYEASDKREEIERVASLICHNVRAGKRYRDIAVLVPDPEAYALVIQSVFAEYKIPYFLDRKKNMAEHPLSRFLLSALEMAMEGTSPESVQAFLANVYFGDADEYRNYLTAYACFRGGIKKEIKDVKGYDKAKLTFQQSRLQRFLLPSHAEGGAYVARLREMLNGTDRTTVNLAGKIKDEMLSDFLTQGIDKINKVLDEAELLTKDYFMDASEFYTILSDGLSACEVSMIPLKSDGVFVGDIAESKFLPVSHLYAVGLNGNVPKVAEDTAMLSDREIALLGDVALKIEPTTAQSNLRTREAVGLNFCSFTDTLSCFVPSDGEGKSELVLYTSHLFTRFGSMGLDFERTDEYDLSTLADKCVTPELAMKQFLLKLQDQGRDEGAAEGTGAVYRALGKRGEEERRDRLYRGEDRSYYIASGEKLFFPWGTVSPTLLESYFDCPYKNFLTRGLKLEERVEGGMKNTDTGNFVHTVLELLAGEIKDGKVESYESCDMRSRALAKELATQAPYVYSLDTAGGSYRMDSLIDETVEICHAMYRTVAQSDFKVVESERKVTFGQLYGKIDRVDETGEFVRVVDYKTGEVDSSPESYYVGKKLQLPLYLHAVSDGKTPAGGFYFPAYREFTKEGEANYKMTGFFNEVAMPYLDKEASVGKSELFDSSQGKSSKKVLGAELFADFVEYSALISENGIKELKKGFVGASPYKECPSWCKFKGLCRSDAEGRPCHKTTCVEIAQISHNEKEES